MASTLLQQSVKSRADLVVHREDIRFYNVSPQRVRIEILVRNVGHGPSTVTTMQVQSAPLGAFLPWRPLATLAVPAIAPGGVVQVETEVERTQVTPLGSFSSVPPGKVLTAIGAGRDDDADAPQSRQLQLFAARLLARRRLLARPGVAAGPLAPDILELVGIGSAHWAGNLNVFIGTRAVERHMAQSLRIYSGQTNLAMFLVGTGNDAYRFDIEDTALAEFASIHNGTDVPFHLAAVRNDPIEPGQWLEADGRLAAVLAIRVPEECNEGAVTVHVIQRSTDKIATVEFTLDANAAGPGCYAV